MTGQIPQAFIDDILDRTDIVELIDSRVKLRKTGRNYQARCPFHDEKTPSFSVNPDKQFYYCFGCGAGGNAISFVMDYDRLDFPQTIESLAKSIGIEVPREHNPDRDRQQQAKKSIYDLLEQSSQFFEQQLRQHPDKQQPIDYLKQRGLNGEICKRFGIGYAPAGWDNLLTQIGSTAEAIQLLTEAGMLIEKEQHEGKSQKFYDRFRERLMFPIRDNRGRTIAFGGRVLNDDKPKYLNSPETPVFHKQMELYGLYEARKSNRHLERLLMVEGYMDVVVLAQYEINWAVATLGTSAGTAHMEKVFRHCNEVIFCFDGDDAGRKAAARALEAVLPLMQSGRQAKFLLLPDGEDPDSLVRSIGKDSFIWQVDNAPSLSQYLFDSASESLNLNLPDDKALLIERVMPKIEMLPKGPFYTLIQKSLSEKTGLPLDDILALAASMKPAEPQPQTSYNDSFNEQYSNQHEYDVSAHYDENTNGEYRPKQRQKLSTQERSIKRTPAKSACAMLLFRPDIGTKDGIELTLSDDELQHDDLQLLTQLLTTIKQQPSIQTANIIGQLLAKKQSGVTQLLALEHQSEGEEEQEIEFFDAISQLNKQKAKQQRISQREKISNDIRLDQLSPTEREQYLSLFKRH